MLMESTPNELDMKVIKLALKQIKFVKNVHDLHVWSLSDGKVCMSVHLLVASKHKGIYD